MAPKLQAFVGETLKTPSDVRDVLLRAGGPWLCTMPLEYSLSGGCTITLKVWEPGYAQTDVFVEYSPARHLLVSSESAPVDFATAFQSLLPLGAGVALQCAQPRRDLKDVAAFLRSHFAESLMPLLSECKEAGWGKGGDFSQLGALLSEKATVDAQLTAAAQAGSVLSSWSLSQLDVMQGLRNEFVVLFTFSSAEGQLEPRTFANLSEAEQAVVESSSFRKHPPDTPLVDPGCFDGTLKSKQDKLAEQILKVTAELVGNCVVRLFPTHKLDKLAEQILEANSQLVGDCLAGLLSTHKRALEGDQGGGLAKRGAGAAAAAARDDDEEGAVSAEEDEEGATKPPEQSEGEESVEESDEEKEEPRPRSGRGSGESGGRGRGRGRPPGPGRGRGESAGRGRGRGRPGRGRGESAARGAGPQAAPATKPESTCACVGRPANGGPCTNSTTESKTSHSIKTLIARGGEVYATMYAGSENARLCASCNNQHQLGGAGRGVGCQCTGHFR